MFAPCRFGSTTCTTFRFLTTAVCIVAAFPVITVAQTAKIKVTCYDLEGLILSSTDVPDQSKKRVDVLFDVWLAREVSGPVTRRLAADRFRLNGPDVQSLDRFEQLERTFQTEGGTQTIEIPLPALSKNRAYLVLSFRRTNQGVTAISPLLAVVRDGDGNLRLTSDNLQITVPEDQRAQCARQCCPRRHRCAIFGRRRGC